jgi:hypothetical protein
MVRFSGDQIQEELDYFQDQKKGFQDVGQDSQIMSPCQRLMSGLGIMLGDFSRLCLSSDYRESGLSGYVGMD